MALNWDATDCGAVALSDEHKNKTQHFCFVLMAVGARRITEQNYEELHRRASLYEKLFGGFFFDSVKQEDTYLTVDDFKLRIGYVTNATPLTQKRFMASVEARWFWASSQTESLV
jgi:hypothetical protein